MRFPAAFRVTVLTALLAFGAPGTGSGTPPGLPGFSPTGADDEQTTSFVFEPGMKVRVNAPPMDAAKPAQLILFALPNGNTTSQTIGKVMAPGDDWHYDIQHIGAQTRRLREILPGENIVTAYLEADSRSWPGWRRKHPDSSARIVAMVDHLRGLLDGYNPAVALTGHSGGGSLILGFINGVETIPPWVDRIAWLDANYAVEASERHGTKLINWLNSNPKAVLFVLAYDDRNIMLDGEPVVNPTGGTFRATMRTATDLATSMPLTETSSGDFITTTGLDGRIYLSAHKNPENKILHTVLVVRNGLVHAMLYGRQDGPKLETWTDEKAYRKWIRD